MTKKLLVVLALVCLTAAATFAQAFTVSYMDGTVELQNGKAWKALAIGDSVADTAIVRLSDSASLELTRGKMKISLLKDGTYDIAALAKAAGATSTSAVGSAVTQKLQALVAEKPKQSTAGGVRGAQQGSGTVTWVDEGDEAKSQAQTLLDKKQYTDAAKVLSGAIEDASSDQDTSELSYMLAVAYYGGGQLARAYRTLAKISPTADLAWYGRYVLLKAQVLVDTSNFTDALALLTAFLKDYSAGEAAQTAYLLSGICQKALGDANAAKQSWDTGYALLPTSDTAKLIDQQRKS